MSTGPLTALPALATTGVGSLPFTDPMDAIAHLDAYELPFCPQLPGRDGDMLQEWLGGDPRHCGWSPDRDRERPAAWEAFLELLRDDGSQNRVVKLQVTGPVTLAMALERTSGRRGLGAEARALAGEIAGWLAAIAAGQVRALQALQRQTLLMVDEPGLASAGLSREHAGLWDPLRAVSEIWGIHVCGAVPWALIDSAAPDAVSFDLTRGALQADGRTALVRLANRGGRIVWGVLDPVRPGEVEQAAARLIAAMAALDEAGRPARIASASLLSPACGSGRLSVDGELRLARSLGEVAGVVRDGLAAVPRLPRRAGHG